MMIKYDNVTDDNNNDNDNDDSDNDNADKKKEPSVVGTVSCLKGIPGVRPWTEEDKQCF